MQKGSMDRNIAATTRKGPAIVSRRMQQAGGAMVGGLVGHKPCVGLCRLEIVRLALAMMMMMTMMLERIRARRDGK
jgi:hypothetical protein